ncbi:MAG: hypothetical protein ACXIUM_04930 [Wenzhouxiangella sp.]
MHRRFRLRIEQAPAEAERRDLLELILAAASLELELELLLLPAAVDLFWPSMNPGWQQLLDHDLARVMQVCPPAFDGTLPPGVLALTAEQVPPLPPGGLELSL